MTKSSLALSENEVSVDPQAWPVQPLSSPEGGSAAPVLLYSTGYGGVDVLSNPLSLQTWHRLLRYWGLAWNRIAKERNTILRISRLFFSMISAGVDFDCSAIRMSVTSHQPLLSVCIWANLLSLGLSPKEISLICMDSHLAYLSTQMVLSLTLRWIRQAASRFFLSHVYLSAVYWYDIHLSHFESNKVSVCVRAG